MRKIYESPRMLFDSVNAADVIATSNALAYNKTQNAEIDDRDVRAFSDFFSNSN